MQAHLSFEGDQQVLHLEDSLEYVDTKEWTQLTAGMFHQKCSSYLLDLTKLISIDSVGLGMMLTLKKAAELQSRTVTLRFDPKQGVGHILTLARFDTMFPVHLVDSAVAP